MPRAVNARANSTMPVLSETLSSARRTDLCKGLGLLSADSKLFEFLAQGAAIDTEDRCGAALVAVHVIHDDLEKWLFHFPHHEVVQTGRAVPVERIEIAVQRLFGL